MARSDSVSFADLKADLETAFGAAYKVNPNFVIRIRGLATKKTTDEQTGKETYSLYNNPILRFVETEEEFKKVLDFADKWLNNNLQKMDKVDPRGYQIESFPLNKEGLIVKHTAGKTGGATSGIDLTPLIAKFKALSPTERKVKAEEMLAAGIPAEQVNNLLMAAALS